MWSAAPALEQEGPVLCSAVLPCPSCCRGRCPALLSHPASHTQHTQVSCVGASKYVITSSSVFSSLDHPEGPERHVLLFRGHCSRARGRSCTLVPLHSEYSPGEAP